MTETLELLLIATTLLTWNVGFICIELLRPVNCFILQRVTQLKMLFLKAISFCRDIPGRAVTPNIKNFFGVQ